MTSGSGEKLCEALKAIIDDLNENINNHQDIEDIEAENKRLCQKKMELIVNLSRPSAAATSIVLVKDITMRQKTCNQFRFESKQNSVERFKDHSRNAHSETSSLKQKLKGDDNFMTSPYHDVVNKIMELNDKKAEHNSVIQELTNQHSKLVQNEQIDVDEAEDIRFIEVLKSIAEEQRKLIEKLKEAAKTDNRSSFW